jgi:hypothetical protein
VYAGNSRAASIAAPLRAQRSGSLFHSRTPFQNETRARAPPLFHREPRGSCVNHTRCARAGFVEHFGDVRLARRVLSPAAGGDNPMSWLDAHAAYVMEIVARERADDLRAERERDTARSRAIPEARAAKPVAAMPCCLAFARASR